MNTKELSFAEAVVKLIQLMIIAPQHHMLLEDREELENAFELCSDCFRERLIKVCGRTERYLTLDELGATKSRISLDRMHELLQMAGVGACCSHFMFSTRTGVVSEKLLAIKM